MKFKSLSWSKIETHWNQLRTRHSNDELARAIFLQQLRDKHPWTDRSRYTSQAVYDELVEYSFEDIVKHRLREGVAEVKNTLRVLDTFGSAAFKRHGRVTLLRIYNRLDGKRARASALQEIDRHLKKLGRPTPSITVTTMVLDKFAPRKSRTNTLALVRKLKEANARLKKQIKVLEAENKQLRLSVQSTSRKRRNSAKAAARKLKAV